MNHNKEAKSLTFRRGSEDSQVLLWNLRLWVLGLSISIGA